MSTTECAIIENKCLARGAIIMQKLVMENAKSYASRVIDALGGTTSVAKEIDSPKSTVHSWRVNGIPSSRLSHLKLLAWSKRIDLPEQDIGNE
jgi:hypothetical protein